ncbi:MAG: PIN domain-containing protein [Candidatus Diapherotrites archaeon]
MSEALFFFDTYAFFEIIRGNAAYRKYETANVITTIFNLAELNYALKKEHDKKTADRITSQYEMFLVDVSIQDLFEATDLKSHNRKLSIPDVIGYIVAKRYGAKFLTGDKEFKNMANVEFVK